MIGKPAMQTGDDFRHIWRELFTGRAEQPRPALFLDRDGVIVEWVPYLQSAADVRLIQGAAESIARANRRGILVVLVTNQAGVGRGYYGWEQFQDVQRAMLRQLHLQGARLDAVFACPHHAQAAGEYAHPDHPARKPRPGMLLGAAMELNIDLPQSWIVGDSASDLEAGRAAGLAGGVLVLTGLGRQHRDAASSLSSPRFEVRIAACLPDAVAGIPPFG